MWHVTLTRLLSDFVKIQRMQLLFSKNLEVYKQWQLGATILRMSSSDNNIEEFLSDDTKKILKVINDHKIEDLLQYSITKKRAQNLKMYRVNNGPYNSLKDLLQVKGLNGKCLNKFYKSILCGKKNVGRKKVLQGLILTPKNTGNHQKDVNTVLGIYIGQDMISWSLLNRDCEVLEWSYKSFPWNPSKKNLHSLLQMTLPIAINLPKADRYIMQEIGGDIGYQESRKFYHTYVEQCIISAAILSSLTTLNCKFDNTTEFVANNIFILRQHVLRKIYGLIVGNEAISTQYMLQRLLQESDESIKTKEHLPSVLIKAELRNMYSAQKPIYQEQISWSLLIALAFLELVVHQRADMILRNVE